MMPMRSNEVTRSRSSELIKTEECRTLNADGRARTEMTQPVAPFEDLPRTPAAHFKLYFLATVARVLDELAVSCGSDEAVDEQFPFLVDYREELSERQPAGLSADESRRWWRDALAAWERGESANLPLARLARAARLEHDCLTLFVCAGLIEEDARFGQLFEAVQETPGQRRPTVGLVSAWWREPEDCREVRANLRRLRDAGLIQFLNCDAPRAEWALQAQPALWDALRGETPHAPAAWAHYRAASELAELSDLVLPRALAERVAFAPALLASGEATAFVVRGPGRNGRGTLAGALARKLGLGVLEIDAAVPGADSARVDEERWRTAGPLAAALDAMPVVRLDLAPGDTFTLPPLACSSSPLAVVAGRHGGVAGAGVERALTVTTRMPTRNERREHWRRALGPSACRELEEIAESFRMTSGNVRRAARLARVYSSLEGRDELTVADVREAARALGREALETLATRVETEGDWSLLSVAGHTFAELRALEARCRQRERLTEGSGALVGGARNSGVRALFSGASGTGKTLAARLLAASLGKDLYRLDLSTVVNKYIGETEKNLSQIFARAEELDVMLLLDEGDALLTQRTDVSNANDRYANLETNYLLQRLESYEGILVITTNAHDRIDSAFQRRMDVSVNFAPPDSTERWSIWQSHLPASHEVNYALLDEVAHRCELTGGQIRNAVLHAAAVALAEGGQVSDAHVEEAVRREYRKAGAVCPLRRREEGRLASVGRW